MLEKIFNLGRKIIPKWLFRAGQPFWHFGLVFLGNLIYRFPGRKLICIGVTGTNGKSTTIELINAILKETGAKTGMISTIAIEIAGKRTDNITSRTTLGRMETPKLLRKMIKEGVRYAIIEVASEGIVQFRTWGIPFDAAVFTNLSPEHLNTHGNMLRYRNTKGKLFANLSSSKKKSFKSAINGQKTRIPKISVVNGDDKEFKYFSSFPAQKHFLFGIKRGEVRASQIKYDGQKLEFEISYDGKLQKISSKLKGKINVYNLLAAWAVGKGLGVDEKIIKKGLETVTEIKGRMQEIKTGKSFRVFIDYAMTPDSYELLFEEMKNLAKKRVIAVFGAAGGKDKSKRSKIGEVAAKMTDWTILTDDEPYNEDPKKIIEEIETGFQKAGKKNYEVIGDRKEALKKAISIAKEGDVIVVPGMGHEAFRNIGGDKKIAWDEAKIIKELLGQE